MIHDASPPMITHPYRHLLPETDLISLLDLGYRFGRAASFSELALAALDVVPVIFGKDCRAAIHEFDAGGTIIRTHASASPRKIQPSKTLGVLTNGRMRNDQPLMVLAELLGEPRDVGQIRGFDSPLQPTVPCQKDRRPVETPHYVCQWIAAASSGSSLLELNRPAIPLTKRDMAMIGELWNLLVMAGSRLKQVETALRCAETMGERSPVCGWVEIDLRSWLPLRMAGRAEGWLAAIRRPEESIRGIPRALRTAIGRETQSVTVVALGPPKQVIEVTAFPGILPDRTMIVMRKSPGEVAQAIDRPSLTRREREVLSLVGTGAPRGEIALQLGIAKRTVDKHLEQAYAKLRVSGKTEALLKSGI